MTGFPTTTIGMSVSISGGGDLINFLEAMGRRAARQELIPLMKSAMAPVVAAEKGFLSSHTKSGALTASLKERAGAGDRPGVVSVFSAPTATRKQLRKKWSKGRFQQQQWASKIEDGRGRKAVFYAPFLEKGHLLVKRDDAGNLVAVGEVPPYPFAAPAMPELEAAGDIAAEGSLRQIVGE